MFLLRATGHAPLDVDAIRDHLESIGESVLVAGDSRALKVHVHNERPDQVIGYGLSLGDLSRITVENLDNQAQDVRETRAAEFAGSPMPEPTERSIARSETDTSGGNGTGAAADLPALAVVAVTAGDGLAAIFRDFGVASVVQGGQSANPSTGELLEAVGAVPAKEVLLLPNNPNVILAARQVASMTDRPVQVVPTRNAAEGFAALLALDPGMDAAANVGPMTEAGRAIQTVVVTEAVRDATIGGRKVKRGQTIALDPDDGLIAADNDREKCVVNAVAALTPGYELITMFYGDGADLAETESMARKDRDGRARRRDRGPARRSALLPVSHLGRVAGPDGAARERTEGSQAAEGPAPADRPGRAAADTVGPIRTDRGRLAAPCRHPAGLV